MLEVTPAHTLFFSYNTGMVICLCGKEEPLKSYNKHLTLDQRIHIEKGLNEGKNFVTIAKGLGKDPSTISKEVRKHRAIKYWKDPSKMPKCAHLKTCKQKHICTGCYASKDCRDCSKCRVNCSEYTPKTCGRLDKSPYVCNACSSLPSCRYYRWIYVAKYADDSYRNLLISSREGINQTPEDMQALDQLVSPLIKKGQSIAHIFAHHKKEIQCSRRTLYKYIDLNVFTARNIDLPRKVKYKVRKSSSYNRAARRSARVGRSYADFLKRLEENPHTKVVEMDTVEGQKGGKVLLTLLFRSCSFMLAFLLDEKTQVCVRDALNSLSEILGIEVFQKLCQVILTDNGPEFLNTDELESDIWGEVKTRVYYCDPNCSWQKGMIEKNHEFIRYIVPKGHSFDGYTQAEITLMMNHINGTARDSLNGCTPYQLSRLLLDNTLHEKLSYQEISPDDVMLKPALLKQ